MSQHPATPLVHGHDEERESMSLLPHCIPCGSQCCRYSSPILDQNEFERISAVVGPTCFQKVVTGDGHYYVIGRKRDGSERNIGANSPLDSDPCSFLNSDGTCSIQSIKPMDCQAYPVRALPNDDGGVDWYVHEQCPAHNQVRGDSSEDRKMLALGSMQRFSVATYFDWLRRFSPWTLDPARREPLNGIATAMQEEDASGPLIQIRPAPRLP
jgi:Fe-S-cluster containining protein